MLVWLGMYAGHSVIRQRVGLFHPKNGWILIIYNDHLFRVLRYSPWRSTDPKASNKAILTRHHDFSKA